MSDRTFQVLRRPMTVNGTTYKVGEKFTTDTLRWEAWVRTGMAKEVNPTRKAGRKPRTQAKTTPAQREEKSRQRQEKSAQDREVALERAAAREEPEVVEETPITPDEE